MHRFAISSALCLLFCVFVTSASAQTGPDWPGFRGPDFNGAVGAATLLDTDAAGLTLGWKRALGSGYSALAVADGRVVTLFSAGDEDVMAAFETASGDELWRYPIGKTYAGHDGSHDGPISTPTIVDGLVYGLGAWGHLFALDAATGAEIWAKNLVEDHGAKKPHYGFTSSPIVVDDVLIVELGAPEGQAIAGFDAKSGDLKWAVGDDEINYHSPIVASIDGRQQVIAVGNGKLFGIDSASGELLWSYEHGGDQRAMGGSTIVPLPAGEGRFFLMNKIDSSAMLQVSIDHGSYKVSEIWSNNSIRGSYVTPVYHGGHIYAISGRILACVDAASGELKWRSRKPGDGFLTVVGDNLVVMTKPGSLHVAETSSEGYREIASLDLFDEHSWSEVAIAHGHLYARSMGHLARIDPVASADKQAAKPWVADTEFGHFLAGLETATDKTATIDAFLDRQNSFPIIEGSDKAHFVFRGEAKDVGIVGDQVGYRREDPMTPVPGTNFFHYSTRLEPNAAVTYGFIQDFGEGTADPLNPNPAEGLFGEVSWLAMPAWRRPSFLGKAPASQQGSLETVQWEREVSKEVDGKELTTKETRRAQIYLPAGFDASADRRYPTAYFHAGKRALEDGLTTNALDNLIGQSVTPLIAVFVMPPDGEEEDNTGPMGPYLEMMTAELVPLIDDRYPTIRDPRFRASVGAADSGVAALRAGIQHPDVFGLVGSQSAVLFEEPIEELLDEAGQPPLTIYLEWGTYDLRSPHEAWDMAEENREVWTALRERGYRPAGGERPEGHSWRCWSSHTDELLAALFPATGDD